MYAIVEIAGQQFKVQKDQQIFVHRLENKEGDKVSFDKVLLIDNNGKVNVGAPAITGASVTVKVLEHLKGDKVTVFKKKRRKGYKVKNGHRQYLTKIQVEAIAESGATKKVETTKAEKTEDAPAKEVKKAAPKAAAPKASTETTTKKAAPKKAAAKEDKESN